MFTKFLKNQSIRFYLYVAAFLLTLIGLVLYSVNATGAYYNDLQSSIILFSILSLILLLAHIVLTHIFGPKPYFDLIIAVVIVLLLFSATISLNLRVESMGYIWWSDLESGNSVAINALSQYMIALILYLLAVISCVVGAFFNQKKA